jgi:hypothetical protein
MDNAHPDDERYWDAEAQRILLYALELRDRSFTHQQLEQMAQELDISPDLLRAAEKAVRSELQAPTTSAIASIPALPQANTATLFVDRRGLLVTPDYLVVHGRIYPLAGVTPAEKKHVYSSRGTLLLLLLVGFVFLFIPTVYAAYRLFKPQRMYAVMLHLPSGPKSVYMIDDEPLADAIVQAINVAVNQQRHSTILIE